MDEIISQKYRLVKTDDGSFSIYNSEIDELMHSTSGAYEESLLKHVYPSRIIESEKQNLNILDIGFGTGYNALASSFEILKKTDKHISIFSLEYDDTFLPLLEKIKFNDDRDYLYAKIISAYRTGNATDKKFEINLFFGDARKNVKKFPDLFFDAVFHDPFSPFKNPELWSIDFFKELFRITTPETVITTYSSAPQIRRAFLDSGFKIGRSPSVGPKREGTVAFKSAGIDPIPDDEVYSMKLNPKSIPYRDRKLDSGREAIISERIAEMKAFRDAFSQRPSWIS